MHGAKKRGKRQKSARNADALKSFLVCLRGNRGELLGELRLLVGGVVLVQDPFACGGIDGGDRLGIECRRRILIACFHGGKELLDARFESGLDHLILFRLLLGHEYALLRRFDVGHDIYSFQMALFLITVAILA